MLNIILSIILLHFIFGSYSNNGLNCGLFGFSGPKNLSPELRALVLNNIKILGIVNDTRGGDGAGISCDGHVLKKGALKFSELVLENREEFTAIENVSSLFGHSRRSSVGYSKIAKNTHPFEIYTSEKAADPYLIGMHNGTIHNWRELASKYKVNITNIDVDSELMMVLLTRQRNENYPVLSEYYGTGVFVWSFMDDPDSIYFFKGASRSFSYSKENEEERPLFYFYCKLTKGVYFSSMEEGLKLIISNDEKISSVPPNRVHRLRNGKISKTIIEINRDGVGQKDFFTQAPVQTTTQARSMATRTYLNSPIIRNSQKPNGEHCELLDVSFGTSPALISRQQHLYYRNGHPITGILGVDRTTGRVVKSFSTTSSQNKLEKELKEFTQNTSNEAYSVFSFASGLLLNNHIAFFQLTEYLTKNKIASINPNCKLSYNEVKELSKFCRFPFHFYYHKTNDWFYLRGELADGTFYPPFAQNKKYVFENGKFVSLSKGSEAKTFTLGNKIFTENAKGDIVETTIPHYPYMEHEDDYHEDDSSAYANALLGSYQENLMSKLASSEEPDEDRTINEQLSQTVIGKNVQMEVIFNPDVNDEMDAELEQNKELLLVAEAEVCELFNKLSYAVQQAKEISKTCVTKKEFEETFLSGIFESWGIATILGAVGGLIEGNSEDSLYEVDEKQKRIIFKKENANDLF